MLKTIKPLSETTDEALLRLITAHSDMKAFEVLFHRHYKTMCQFVYKLTPCRQSTEEIVSDVFMKIWNNREFLHIQSSLKAYLLISMRNQAIDYLRRQQRRRTVGADAIHPNLPSGYTTADDRVIGDEALDIIEAAIESLPPQGKIIFRLSRDGGMKYREIADHLQLSIKTIETHMSRSLLFLRNEIKGKLGVEL
jgi:RNA polymerase sigma-70 factor, ECF subfamily